MNQVPKGHSKISTTFSARLIVQPENSTTISVEQAWEQQTSLHLLPSPNFSASANLGLPPWLQWIFASGSPSQFK